MACLPGMNCGGYQSNDCCPEVNSNCVDYSGPNLPCSGVQTHDCLTLAIEKIDDKLCRVGNGTSGTSGSSGQTFGTAGTSGTSGTAGTAGSSGTAGTAGINGSSGTSATSGSSGRTFGTAGTNGSSGTSASSGTSGSSGTSATSGSSGTSASSGSSGTSGTTGTDGSSGTSGTNGTSGSSGTSATSGSSGTSGTSASSGSSGTAGTSGSSGTAGISGDRYLTSSSTTFTLGNAGTITVAAGLAYSVAQSVLIAYNDTNYQQSVVIAYNPSTGVLQFDTPSTTVGSGTFSAWQVNLAGASGGDGSSGTSGSSGTAGTSGTNGSSGTTGTSGTSGTSGTDGSSGTSGTSGTNGTSGTSGSNGTSGTSGTNGSNGTSGTNGTSGSSGTAGTSGTSGTNGSSGTSGTSGTNGSSGTSGTNGSSGTSGTNGTSGTSGTNGSNGSSGTSGTSGTNGSNGSSGTSGVQGAAGSSGTSGTNGSNGSNGSSGTSGQTGATGSSGTSGNTGASGSSGTSGVSGAAGSSGTSGTNGSNGTSGANGANGSSGTSGANGAAGSSGTSGAGTISGAVNRIAKFTPNTTTMGDSQLFDDGTNIGYGTINPTVKFHMENAGATYTSPATNNVPTIYLYNSNNASTSAHAILALRTNSANGGNPFISWDISGVLGYSMGIDNADADKLKLSATWSSVATSTILTFTSAGAATFSSSVTASSFIKTGGTSVQFLKADGSIDSNTYLTTSSAASLYIPIAGGVGSITTGQVYFGVGGIGMSRLQNNNAIWWNSGSDDNHVLWNDYYGGPTTRTAIPAGFDGIKWNVYRGIYIQGSASGTSPCLVITNSSSGTADHTVSLYASGTKRFETSTTGATVSGQLYVLTQGAGVSDVNVPIQTSTGGATTGAYAGFNKNGSYGFLVGFSNGLDSWTGSIIRTMTTDPLYFITNGTNIRMTLSSAGLFYVYNKVTIGGDTSADGGLNIRGYGVANATTDFGVILDRGTKIAWAAGGNGSTGEYIYSQLAAPYSISIHSGQYNALQAPNTGDVYINHEAGTLFVGTTGSTNTYKLYVSGNTYVSNALTAGSFVKIGGTSIQFLKADGSVDSSTYLTTSSASSFYVPYTGANANLNMGSFTITAGAFFETSDATIKTLITDDYIVEGIENIASKLYIKDGRQEVGYFAQDVLPLLPNAVAKNDAGLLSLSYKEVHTAKIASLEKRVKELESKLGI